MTKKKSKPVEVAPEIEPEVALPEAPAPGVVTLVAAPVFVPTAQDFTVALVPDPESEVVLDFVGLSESAKATPTEVGDYPLAAFRLPHSGAAVRYVLHTGPNVGQVRDAVIVELYGETMHLEVTTAPGDSFANPLTLIRVPYSAARTVGTWHWPVEA